MNSFSLAWRLLRGGGRRGALGSILTLAAVALVTMLLLFSVAGNLAFAERADHTAWRVPHASNDPTAIESVTTDYVDGRQYTQVGLAATGDGEAPIPPGMDHFPKPGEVWASPAMASLMDELPAGELADRFPAAASQKLGAHAVAHDAELVIVVGYSPDDPIMTEGRYWQELEPTGITDFGSPSGNDTYLLYQALMAIATVLMAVPLLVFGGAAARLTVARRDQRLASLRLIGATPGQVVRLTVAEAMITALLGAVTGAAAYLATTPALARIPIDGAGWPIGQLIPGPLWILAVLTAVPLLVGVSAVIGLRRVVVSPLGVARRQTPPGVRMVRLLALVVFVVAFLWVASGQFGNDGAIALVLLALLAGTFLTMNLVGPWVVSILGRVTAALARKPSTLLAGRRLVDDPRSAWRTVAGIALTGFVAGFIALLAPSDLSGDEPEVHIEVTARPSEAEAVEAALRDTIPHVSISDNDSVDAAEREVFVAFAPRGEAEHTDELRTVLAGEAPRAEISVSSDTEAVSTLIFADVQTGVLVVLSVSVLIAMVSAAISGASSVLDRRQTYGLLHLSGTPMRTLNAARRTETLVPLIVMGGGSLFTGMLLATPFISTSGLSPTGSLALTATVVLGVAGIIAAGALSRPLLRSVMHNTSPRPD